jgi:hypothetical protein
MFFHFSPQYNAPHNYIPKNLSLFPKHEFLIDEKKSFQPKHLYAFHILGESMLFCTYLLLCQDWMKVDIKYNKTHEKIGSN